LPLQKEQKTKYRGPFPFDFAQGQDDGFERKDLGKFVLDSLKDSFGRGGLFTAAGVAVDGALFVAGGAVVFLLGDGGEIGGVILGGHGDGA
jgi:hypothetical protein